MKLYDELEEAVKELNASELRFNNASPEYIDAAIYDWRAKQEVVNIIVAKIKQEPRMAPADSNLKKFIRKYIITGGGKKQ